MKFFLKVFLPVCMIILLYSCKTRLDVNAGWKDIAIVYGILNQSDTVHFIKITKAFLGPGDALQYAQIPDSSNYTSLDASLDEYLNNSLRRTLHLRDTSITDKDSGIFYFPVQKLYYTREKLNEKCYYRLNILNTRTGNLIQSATMLVGTFTLVQPTMLPGIIIVPDKACAVQWISAPGGKRYQLTLRIHYSEYHYGDTARTFHYLDWLTFTKERSMGNEGGQTMTAYLNGEDFYRYLGSNLKADPDIQRWIGRCDFVFLVGSEDLDSYLETSQQSYSFITAKPPFSDIINGIGLFASRHVQSFDTIQFADITKDSLKTNRYTRGLGF